MINLLGTKEFYITPVTLVSEYYAYSPYLLHRKKRKRKEEREGIEEREIKEVNRKKKQQQKRVRKKILLSYKSTEICQKVKNKNK